MLLKLVLLCVFIFSIWLIRRKYIQRQIPLFQYDIDDSDYPDKEAKYRDDDEHELG